MAGRAFVVTKGVFHHKNGNILKPWEWSNDEKHFFLAKFNYINKHLYVEKNLNWDILTSAIFSPNVHCVSQPNTLVVADDSNISHYLNLSINSPSIILSHCIIHTQHDFPSQMNSNLILALPN